jgi:hypothetical protein
VVEILREEAEDDDVMEETERLGPQMKSYVIERAGESRGLGSVRLDHS